MKIEILKSKLYGVYVTQTELDYEGSIIIDRDWMDRACLRPYEKVHVLNKNNGERFETYVIEGKRGLKEICINGAAARISCIHDELIILSYGTIHMFTLKGEGENAYKPTIFKP